MTVRYAREADLAFLRTLDGHVPERIRARNIAEKEIYILEEGGEKAGLLRCGLFWDSIPFCSLLYIVEGARGRGFGSALVRHREGEMKSLGFGLAMTSTQADEEGQHIWRKLGYRDCGGFLLPFPGYEQPLELILAKGL